MKKELGLKSARDMVAKCGLLTCLSMYSMDSSMSTRLITMLNMFMK